MKVRINKYLASRGIASRRKVDELIRDKKVKINNTIAELGTLVDVENDNITVENKIVKKALPTFEYVILNKPKNIVSTVADEKDRNTVMHYINSKNRLFPVGRLDFDSTGLILLTNDGDLALKMTHPKYHISKTYQVSTYEKISTDQINRMKKGVEIYGKITAPALIDKLDGNSFEITLFQGMKRQIREMCDKVGLSVKTLHRISIGNIKIGHLKPGETRHLSAHEVQALKHFVNNLSA